MASSLSKFCCQLVCQSHPNLQCGIKGQFLMYHFYKSFWKWFKNMPYSCTTPIQIQLGIPFTNAVAGGGLGCFLQVPYHRMSKLPMNQKHMLLHMFHSQYTLPNNMENWWFSFSIQDLSPNSGSLQSNIKGSPPLKTWLVQLNVLLTGYFLGVLLDDYNSAQK